MSLRVGVLAVQGDFEAHRSALSRQGVRAAEIRYADQVAGLDGVVLPGGESTTHVRLLEERGLAAAIRRLHEAGGAILGTCAGTILLAKRVTNPEQASLGLIDIDVRRNAFGRQKESFEVQVPVPALGEPELTMVFIRAPRIVRVGPGVEVVAALRDEPVLVRQGGVLAGTFHPELSTDGRIHRLFLEACGRQAVTAS